MEFHHYGLWIGVTDFHDKVLEFIEVFIHRVTLLEISCGFQSVDGCWVCIDWTKLSFELISEVFPINKFMVANIFWLFLLSEYASGPLGCLCSLHVWHGPDDFGLFVCKGFQTETDIDLAGVKEHHSFKLRSSCFCVYPNIQFIFCFFNRSNDKVFFIN